MRSYLDCIPCFLRQALEASRMATDDETIHEHVLRQVLLDTQTLDMRQSPPAMGQRIHRLIRECTGDSDPYRRIKDKFNRVALDLYPKLKARVQESGNPVETAVRFAIAGNIIDCGVNSHLDEAYVLRTVEDALAEPLIGELADLEDRISGARDALYLADNAGEIVLDRILIERMPLEKVTVAVRGSPVLNDATMDDARAAGLQDLVRVVDNGSDAPGTILEDCSGSFRQLFDDADLVIAKGQGNYETLSDVDRDIFFMLKVKCPVIAKDIGCPVGALVLRRSPGR
jgi:uncharacterized protein with ATP-grasp and redox domains